MDDKKQEFDIEDIIREFGSESEDPELLPAQTDVPPEEPAETLPQEKEPEETPPAEADLQDTLPLPNITDIPAGNAEEKTEEAPAPVQTDDPIEPVPSQPAEEAVTDATVRLDPVPEEAVTDATVRLDPVPEETKSDEPKKLSGDTIRIHTIPNVKGTVRDAAHIDDRDEPAPYSDGWEPEYEQPIADYVPKPQPPLPFRAKQRLREIKKQLVEGPEKEYYRLAEKGFGKLQLAIFFSVLVVLLTAVMTVFMVTGGPLSGRLRFMIFVQFIALLMSALLGSFQLVDGFLAILKGRFNLNTLLLFTFIFCTIDGVLCFRQLRIPCCAAFSLQVTMALWSTYQTRTSRMGQLDTMRKATRLDGLFPVTQEGRVYLVRSQGEVEHFTKTDKDTPGKETLLHVYALISLLVSIGTGVLAGVLHGYHTAVQVASVTALAAMPATMLICVRRPMGVLELRLHKHGTVFCGWKGAKALAGNRFFPISHEDLFPDGTVKLNGVKFFGQREPDQIIAYAAALVTWESGTLNPVFSQLLDSRNGMHYEPKEFRFYDGGIGGIVNHEPVLVGSLDFLRTMGVEVPEGLRISQAVCISIDGELSGLFAVTYELTRSAAEGMATLCSYRKLHPVMVSRDFMMTPAFIREHFGVNPKRVVFPDMDQRTALAQLTPEPEADAAALITGEGLSCFAFAATGARSLKTGVNLGIAVHLFGGILGMLMMLALAYLGSTWLLTPANLFLYELVWLVPGILITEWTRSI